MNLTHIQLMLIIGAIITAAAGAHGWGWFLLVALLIEDWP